jgi:MFS family permease
MERQDEILSDTLTVPEGTIFDHVSVGRKGIASRFESAHSDAKVERKTLLFDCLRYLFQGTLDKEICTVLLLMGAQTLGTSASPKASLVTLTSIGFIGMIFTPITQQLANRSRWNNMQFSAFYFALIGIVFCWAAFATSWAMFFTLMALARICDKQQIPLMIDVYCDNYSKVRRGFKVGTALACMPIGGIIFAQCVERFWSKHPDHFRYALLLASLLALCCALCFLKIPARKVVAAQYPPLWDNFKWIAKDRLFATILFLYSLIAIANQMTLPLRVEYLASHKNGLDLSCGTVLTIFAVIQPLASVVSGPLWGKLYDHVNLITMRQCVTVCFLIGIPLFFATHDLCTICLASVLLGIGRSGGVIFWSLWVSDIAPRGKVSAYMSANTAIMGLRDALAPLLGYVLLEHLGPWPVGVMAFVLLVFSLLGFEYLHRHSALPQRISISKK